MTLKTPPRSWQRQLLSLLGIIVIAGNWRWATGHLYQLPASALPAFTSITNNAHYVIGVIVIFAVTGKTITDYRVGAISRFLHPDNPYPERDTPEQTDAIAKD